MPATIVSASSFSTVDEQPARALRHVPTDEQHADRQDRAEAEGEPPADRRVHQRGIQQRQGEQRTAGGAQPEGAVDHHVDPTAVVLGDQLVDRGVDRRVLTADARPGEEPADEVPGGVHREGGQHRGHGVEHQA